jgi:Fe-S cluster assembly iron-binding protein IscA
VSECHGVRVAVDRKSASRLTGTQIRLSRGPDEPGFVFNNPLAVRTMRVAARRSRYSRADRQPMPDER